MNDNKDVEFLFKFYWKNLISDPKIFQSHPLLGKRLMKLSESYFLTQSKKISTIDNNEDFIDNILFKANIPLDISPDNYLFLRFIKFHLGFVRFRQWYNSNNFSKLEVNETIMNDYLTKSLILCFEKNKSKIKDKLARMSDFQLISNICRRERLTLFNFLKEFETEAKAKDYVNSLYLKSFRGRVYNLDFSKDNMNTKVEDLFGFYSKERL
jgi:hypothetical protein